ncbi:hypothetical protein MTR67_038855 [Solanum verrucosum]|uniref:Integrase core domain containing protein n=1 Tax=Solanum verrucosum TaxID=315347 RepID=A0AAF0ZQ35_SOLVR|nr:hypothetical protein MTR67_038855 [Solanum verrucosum]
MQVVETAILLTTGDTKAPPSTVTSQAESSSQVTPSSRSTMESYARMEYMMDRKIQMELASLRADVDVLLAPSEIAPEGAPTVEKDEVVVTALFGDTMPPPDSSRVAGKRHCSNHTFDTKEAR